MNYKIASSIFITLFANLAFANNDFSECNIKTPAGTECKASISYLHPGQANVGMFAINMTKPEKGVFSSTNKKCTNGTLEEDLQKRGSNKKGIAGVIGPNGVIYLIDGHHHSYSLYLLAEQENSCNYNGEVYVYIVDNKYTYNEVEFSKYMQENQYVWLKDKYGEEIDFSELPDKMSKIGDDPYRSLVKLIADSECNSNHPIIDGDNETTYLEFYWGNRLKKYEPNYYDIDEKNASAYTVNAYNYIVQHQEYFRDLPGFIKVDSNTLCNKAF